MANHRDERKVLRELRRHFRAKGYAPSMRELAAATGIHTATLQGHLVSLERAGAIQWTRRIARGIRVLPNDKGVSQ